MDVGKLTVDLLRAMAKAYIIQEYGIIEIQGSCQFYQSLQTAKIL